MEKTERQHEQRNLEKKVIRMSGQGFRASYFLGKVLTAFRIEGRASC